MVDLVDLTPPPLTPRRKGFWFGFLLALGACSLAACVGLYYSDELGDMVGGAVTRAEVTPPPPTVDEAGARARLNKAAGIALACPFPDPQIILNKAYGELDLFYGERFVKRYHVDGAANAAAGTYAVIAHEPPPAGTPLRIGLAGCEPTSATSAMRLHAGRVTPGAGRLSLVGVKIPAEAGAGIATAGELRLSEDEAAELYTATEPGSLVVVVEQ